MRRKYAPRGIRGFARRHQSQAHGRAAKAQRRIGDGAILLDVREQQEWQSGHVQGARHFPLGQLAQQPREVPQGRPASLAPSSRVQFCVSQEVVRWVIRHSLRGRLPSSNSAMSIS